MIEKIHKHTQGTTMSTVLSHLSFKTLMKSSTQGPRSPRLSKLTKSSNKERQREQRNNGKENNNWEKSQTLFYCQQLTGILSWMTDKHGLLTSMRPTVLPVLSWTSNGNSSQLPIRARSKWLRLTWLNPKIKSLRSRSNCQSILQSDFIRAGQRRSANLQNFKESTKDFPFKNGWTQSLRKRQHRLTFQD